MNTVEEILSQIGYNLVDFGQEYRAKPLYRPSDNSTSLCIRKSTGQWYDFSERTGGSLNLLIQKTLGDIPAEIKEKILSGNLRVRDEAIELNDIKKFDKSLLIKLDKNHDYWMGRGISKHIIEEFKGGVALNGRMANRYVFPIFNERHDLVGFSGRTLFKNTKSPKWKHLGKKSLWCYPVFLNQESIIEEKEVILVESIGDMLALFNSGIRNVIVTFGLDISSAIIEYLLKVDVNRIYISFNNDINNNNSGNIAAQEGKEKLINYFDESQISIALPESKNDFGVMTHEEILTWKQNLHSVQPFQHQE